MHPKILRRFTGAFVYAMPLKVCCSRQRSQRSIQNVNCNIDFFCPKFVQKAVQIASCCLSNCEITPFYHTILLRAMKHQHTVEVLYPCPTRWDGNTGDTEKYVWDMLWRVPLLLFNFSMGTLEGMARTRWGMFYNFRKLFWGSLCNIIKKRKYINIQRILLYNLANVQRALTTFDDLQ